MPSTVAAHVTLLTCIQMTTCTAHLQNPLEKQKEGDSVCWTISSCPDPINPIENKSIKTMPMPYKNYLCTIGL